MKKNFIRCSIILLGLLLTAPAAMAVPVLFNDLQTQTVDGQDFNFLFGPAPVSDGTGGTLILHAQGDYDGRDDETLSWDIEGIIGAGPIGGFNDVVMPIDAPQGGPFDFVNVFQSLGNVEFQRTYSIGAADLAAILLDGIVSIDVDLDENVGLFDAPNYVEFTLSYNSVSVPEPATMLLLGTGLIGLAGFRRRFKK